MEQAAAMIDAQGIPKNMFGVNPDFKKTTL